MARTIVLNDNAGFHEEAPAGAALTPGHLIMETSTGTVIKHATPGGLAQRLFAKEDALQARTIDTAYALDEKVFYYVAAKGSEVFAYLKAGINYTQGTALFSAGDGTLTSVAGLASAAVAKGEPIAYVRTALNLSASGAVATRTKVRVN